MDMLTEAWFNAPNGPDLPFGTTELIVLDSMRVLIFVLGTLVILMTPLAMFHTRTSIGQLTRIFSLALLVIVSITTEYAHLGDYANFRLFFNIVAAFGAAWGMWSLFRFETPAQIKGPNAQA